VRDVGAVIGVRRCAVLADEIEIALPQGHEKARPIMLFIPYAEDVLGDLVDRISEVIGRHFEERRTTLYVLDPGTIERPISKLC
jgi:hypothetical protein